MTSPTPGSQRLLQQAVNANPAVLAAALRRAGALGKGETITWKSPLKLEKFREYRDKSVLEQLALNGSLSAQLRKFWPARAPVWDALALVSDKSPLLVEAKAHIAEAVTSPSKATSSLSQALIERSLETTRRKYAPRSKGKWGSSFYQYANRLAFQFFLREVNKVNSRLVFLYFVNATDVQGPTTEDEWRGAIRTIHALMGLPESLVKFGVYEVFVDAHDIV
jgi:hypothetical protein